MLSTLTLLLIVVVVVFLIAFLLLVILGVFRTVGEVIQTVGVIFRTVGEVFFLHPEASLHPVGELLFLLIIAVSLDLLQDILPLS